MSLKNDKVKRLFDKRETITFRLTLKYALMVFITLLVVSASTLLSVSMYINNTANAQLMNISETVVNKLKVNETITNVDLQEISHMNENIDVNINKGGEVVFKTSELYGSEIPLDVMNTVDRFEVGENNYIFLNTSMIDSDGNEYIVQVVKDTDNDQQFIEILFTILIVINVIAVGISVILGYIMSIRALSPINKIINQAQKITVSDLSQRIVINGPDDELKKLSDTFNQLISRVEVGYEKQNRFALDASHELATPLAVIKGYLDIIERWGRNDPSVLEEAIENMQKEVKNVTSLLDTLLFIAKGDNDISNLDIEACWINELIVEAYKEAKLIYTDRNFEIEANQSIQLKLDKKLIKQMIRALIDNSVKYSSPGTSIKFSCWQSGSNMEFMITDQGIGIEQEDLNHIFDRFYRVDQARTREIGGTGLGLSIVKWIVEMHHGEVEVISEIGKGTSVGIILPISN